MAESSNSSRWRDLGVRLAAAAVLAPVVLFCVWWGGSAYLILLIVTGAGIAWEWCALAFGQDRSRFQLIVHVVSVIGALLFVHAGYLIVGIALMAVCFVLSAVLSMKANGIGFWQNAGVPYVTVPILALYFLRLETGFGFLALLWLLLVIWTTDTFAYFSGRLIGGPKLTRFSPNKTWAGLGGGAVGAALVSGIVAMAVDLSVLWFPIALAAVVAVVSQAGDIFESAAKRHFNVKDSSNLIPGHGGILDRIDGLMFAAMFCVGLALLNGGSLQQAGRFLFW